MDALTCKSARTCPTCEFFVRGGCALEAAILAATAPPPRAPSMGLAVVDRRALA